MLRPLPPRTDWPDDMDIWRAYERMLNKLAADHDLPPHPEHHQRREFATYVHGELLRLLHTII